MSEFAEGEKEQQHDEGGQKVRGREPVRKRGAMREDRGRTERAAARAREQQERRWSGREGGTRGERRRKVESAATSRRFVFSLFPRGLLINYCD